MNRLSGAHHFVPPGTPQRGNDWVLVLDAGAEEPPPPGTIRKPRDKGQASAAKVASDGGPSLTGATKVPLWGRFETIVTRWAAMGDHRCAYLFDTACAARHQRFDPLVCRREVLGAHQPRIIRSKRTTASREYQSVIIPTVALPDGRDLPSHRDIGSAHGQKQHEVHPTQ